MRLPKAPQHLSARAKRLWRQVNEDFILEPEALAILELALRNLDLGDQARGILQVEGLVIEGRRHPAVDIVKQSDSLFLRGMRELRLDVEAPGKRG